MFATGFFRWSYGNVLKPLLFRVDPEHVHDAFVRIGHWLGAHESVRGFVGWLFRYEHPALVTDVCGIRFANPIGLSAGFDKIARLLRIMPAVGFGFEEIGSVTGEPCAGNPKPRLWRLPKSRGLVVNYGLMNDGCEAIASRLKGKRFEFPVGVNVAKTNSPDTVETEAGIRDYVKAMRIFVEAGVGDFFVINISCPNAFGGEPFGDPARLDLLLAAIDGIATDLPAGLSADRQDRQDKPVFVKIAGDTTIEQMDGIIRVADRHRVHGFVIANLTKKRENPALVPGELSLDMTGGLSGAPVTEPSNALISHVYRATGGGYVIIGVGGIFTAEDAYEKIRLGATLVELITGMIYEGPQLIGEINRGLVRLLRRDGFANVKDAVGSAHRIETIDGRQ